MRKIILIVYIVVRINSLFSISVGIVEPNITTEDDIPNLELIDELNKRLMDEDPGALIQYKMIKGGSRVFSIFEASAVAENQNLDIVMFGFAEYTKEFVEIEYILYDHNSRRALKTFFSKTAIEDEAIAISFLAQQVNDYLYESLNFNRNNSTDKVELALLVPYSGLSSLAFTGDVGSKLVGIAQLHGGLVLQPFQPFQRDTYGYRYVRTGFGLSYGISINSPNMTSSILHGTNISIFADTVYRYLGQHNFILGLGVDAVIDVFYQNPAYDQSETFVSSTISTNARVGYELLFNESSESGLGFMFIGTGTWYSSPIYSLSFAINYRWGM
jgi:hypothetical protein